MYVWGSRRDTRRKRHGRMLGGHHGASYAGDGKYIKNQYWRAERRYWKSVATSYLCYGDDEKRRIRMGTLGTWRSELCYKGW